MELASFPGVWEQGYNGMRDSFIVITDPQHTFLPCSPDVQSFTGRVRRERSFPPIAKSEEEEEREKEEEEAGEEEEEEGRR